MNSILVVAQGDSADMLGSMSNSLAGKLELISSLDDLLSSREIRDGACVVFDDDANAGDVRARRRVLSRLRESQLDFVIISSSVESSHIHEAFAAGARDYISKPLHHRETILRLNAVLVGRLRVACVGGGSGLFALLEAVKGVPNVVPFSIVSMADDGGSSGRLSESFTMLPPGDVRKSLIALSNAPPLMNHVMQFRFDRGDALSGHSVGNLILTALSEITGSVPQAVKAMGDILNVQGVVLCASRTRSTLVAQFEDGRTVRGESNIDLCKDRPHDLKVRDIRLEPAAVSEVDAQAAILAADMVTIGPGDLYTSVLANFCVAGIREAIVASRGKRVYVCNMMTKPGETATFDAADHVREVIRCLGGDHLDVVIVSTSVVPSDVAKVHAETGRHSVATGTARELQAITKAKIIFADLSSEDPQRHDTLRLRRVLSTLLAEQQRESSTSNQSTTDLGFGRRT